MTWNDSAPTFVDPYDHLNITRLTHQLWTGGDLPDSLPEAAAIVETWTELGIGAVVDVREEWSDEATVARLAPDIDYLHAGVDDAGQAMPDEWFDKVTRFANARLAEQSGVLVHCHMGINRGPSAAFAVLLANGWDPVEAIGLIRNERPIAAVEYAEDALRWWHRTADVPVSERREERDRLRAWRRSNPHDTVRIIREITAADASR